MIVSHPLLKSKEYLVIPEKSFEIRKSFGISMTSFLLLNFLIAKIHHKSGATHTTHSIRGLAFKNCLRMSELYKSLEQLQDSERGVSFAWKLVSFTSKKLLLFADKFFYWKVQWNDPEVYLLFADKFFYWKVGRVFCKLQWQNFCYLYFLLYLLFAERRMRKLLWHFMRK